MTKDQLHIAFKIEMDKNSNNIAFGSYPAFLPEEIDYWLDKAIYQVISNKFTGNNALKQPFEGSIKRIHDLEKLITTQHVLDCQPIRDTNSIVLKDAFKDKMFYIDGVLRFDNNKTNIVLIEHNNVNKFIQTYDNIPWIEHAVAVIENNDLLIYYDPVLMNSKTYKVDLTFVNNPIKMGSLSEDSDINFVPDYMFNEIIDRAVTLALENIESNRVTVKSQLNQLDE